MKLSFRINPKYVLVENPQDKYKLPVVPQTVITSGENRLKTMTINVPYDELIKFSKYYDYKIGLAREKKQDHLDHILWMENLLNGIEDLKEGTLT